MYFNIVGTYVCVCGSVVNLLLIRWTVLALMMNNLGGPGAISAESRDTLQARRRRCTTDCRGITTPNTFKYDKQTGNYLHMIVISSVLVKFLIGTCLSASDLLKAFLFVSQSKPFVSSLVMRPRYDRMPLVARAAITASLINYQNRRQKYSQFIPR